MFVMRWIRTNAVRIRKVDQRARKKQRRVSSVVGAFGLREHHQGGHENEEPRGKKLGFGNLHCDGKVKG